MAVSIGSQSLDTALLCTSTYALIKGINPPSTASKDSRKAGEQGGDWISRIGLLKIVKLAQLGLLLLCAAQIRSLFKSGSSTISWIQNGYRIPFRVGCLLAIFGGAMRVYCFRALGRFFTFDLAVHPDQKVIQSGPYAWVRHPSYTAIMIAFGGHAMANGPCGPLTDDQIRQKMSIGTWVMAFVQVGFVLLRIIDEEKMLRRELKRDYDDYCKKVPYRLIPYLL